MSLIEADVQSTRRLFARLRDVMAGEASAQDRLDRVTAVIADSLHAAVCSVYLMRAGEVLELFATQGLRRSAIHRTRLRVAEGLVGEVAAHGRSLSLADAWTHPLFAYRPETGEERYHAFVGVPIVRSARVVGVLVVQNQHHRVFSDVEVETLETVAMVLAELISSSNFIGRNELLPADGIGLLPMCLDGVVLSPGISIGTVVLHEPRRFSGNVIADNPSREIDRLYSALQALHTEVDDMLGVHAGDDEDFYDVLHTYLMFARDKGWVGRISDAVRSGLTAEAAVLKVHDDTRVRMHQISDPYLRERLYDLEDLTNRLLKHLIGNVGHDALPLPCQSILVCRTLGPTELLDYDRSALCGLVMEEGSRTMHAVITAKALGIPVVGRVSSIFSSVESGDALIVDGEHGQVFMRPSDELRQQYVALLTRREQQVKSWECLKDAPATSQDSVTVRLMMNAGLIADVSHLGETGAEGVGLYRTELPFMGCSSLPDVATQKEFYQKVFSLVGSECPVIFRTLDVGSDKILPYWQGTHEDNPALGWRSVRISLDRPAVLRTQVRALIQAAHDRPLSVMFPMVTTVVEYKQARAIVQVELQHQKAAGYVPTHVQIGSMLEVPSLLHDLSTLLAEVDFISIGTNDLSQFMFAMDRGNPLIEERYDPLSSSFLKVIRQTVTACSEAGVPCSICGEMAGRPLDALALVALGTPALSMSASSIGPVKAAIRSVNIRSFADYLEGQLDKGYCSLRERLRNYLCDRGVFLS